MKFVCSVILVLAGFFPGNLNHIDAADILSQNLDMSQLANQNFTIDDIKTLVKKKCENTIGDDSGYENIEKGAMTLMDCVNDIFNATAVQAEIEIARPQGELDAVFNKYCRKRPEAIVCVDSFLKTLEPCLDDEEKKHSSVFLRVTTGILNFVCFKGGDQIALFIAEKGPECLEENKEVISNCMNTTFSDYVPKNLSNPFPTMPQFIIGPKQCREVDEFEKCVVDALEKCTEITPANVIQSMFKFIKNETMCPLEMTEKMTRSSAAVHSSYIGVFVIMLSLIIKQTYF